MDLSNIRTLTADEIEVRIGTKAKSGNGAKDTQPMHECPR